MSCTSDHTGKRSQGRLSALMGGVTACVLCVAPLWGGPTPQMEIVLVLMGVPGGLAVWQKVGASKEGSARD